MRQFRGWQIKGMFGTSLAGSAVGIGRGCWTDARLHTRSPSPSAEFPEGRGGLPCDHPSERSLFTAVTVPGWVGKLSNLPHLSLGLAPREVLRKITGNAASSVLPLKSSSLKPKLQSCGKGKEGSHQSRIDCIIKQSEVKATAWGQDP